MSGGSQDRQKPGGSEAERRRAGAAKAAGGNQAEALMGVILCLVEPRLGPRAGRQATMPVVTISRGLVQIVADGNEEWPLRFNIHYDGAYTHVSVQQIRPPVDPPGPSPAWPWMGAGDRLPKGCGVSCR